MQKFVHSLAELTRVSYLRRNERYDEVPLGFYDSSMIMICGRRSSLRSSEECDLDQARSRRRLDLSLFRAGVNHG